MTSQQLDEERIFHLARRQPDADAQAEYLDQVCAGDQALRERVEELLRVHKQGQSFLASNNQQVAATVDLGPSAEGTGATIGRYKLIEQIGEGGMGTVFVAQLLDAGTTDQCRPYFVMELVSGIPITEYCDEHKLSINQRFELFVQVCQAIQHAHQKGIIHRDVKPSNVLVRELDGKPVPKVIDFGVAKALNQSLTDRTIYTSFQSVIGTPLYMSPEQASLSAVDVDTRSDVYSLGGLS